MNERRQKNGGAQTEGQARCFGRGNVQRLTLNAQRSKFNLGDGLGGSPGAEWRCQARDLGARGLRMAVSGSLSGPLEKGTGDRHADCEEVGGRE